MNRRRHSDVMDEARTSAGTRRGIDAIVVGAGVVGSAIALGLARSGFRVALVEARAARPWHAEDARDLRVFAIAPASSRLLQRLGVWEGLRAARAHPYREMRIWDAGAEGELRFRATDAGADALGHIVEQGAIQHALWTALQRESHVELHCPASLGTLSQDAGGVALELDDGTRLAARLAIAADGADSALRVQAGLEVDGESYGQRGLVAYVTTEEPHADTAWQRFLPGGPLALLPCSDGLGSIVWTLPDAEATRLLSIDERVFEEELARAFGGRFGRIAMRSDRAAFPLRMQLAQRYVAGRVVLAGDAAHVVHPLAGQGVNLGLQDAIVLTEALAAARDAGRDFAAASTLRRYERARRSDNALAARAFDGLNRLFSNDALLPTLLRGPALGLVDRLGPIKRLLAAHAAGIR
jgi:3-demethoxyubiquinol 3-hydroxylase